MINTLRTIYIRVDVKQLLKASRLVNATIRTIWNTFMAKRRRK